MPCKYNKNKGFTLVELIAVIVILITIMLIAITTVSKQMEKTKLNAFIEEANVFSKAGLTRYSDDKTNGTTGEDLFHNVINGKVCYSIENQLLHKYVTKSGDKYKGSVEVCFGLNCTYQTKIWITDGEHYIDGVTDPKDINLIKDRFTTDYPYTCGVEAVGGSGNGGDLTTALFEYTGTEYAFNIIKDGVYSLEAWGAQGGLHKQYRGGYGGYSYAEVELHVGDVLYVRVGGKGTDIPTAITSGTIEGGYNGGGLGLASDNDSVARPSGGGATTITMKPGALSTPITSDYVYIVAGGGGAARGANTNYGEAVREGYNGGGFKDESGSVTQSAAVYGAARYNEGHGGGYYTSNTQNSNYIGRYVGRGGSGYIGNPLLRNAVMYGYNVAESSDVKTKTINTAYVSEKPIAGYAKQGNGYAKITYIGDFTN